MSSEAAAMTTESKNTTPQKRSKSNSNNRRRGKRPKDGSSTTSSSSICFSWAKNGTCNRGDGCRFSHEENDPTEETNRSNTNNNDSVPADDSKKKSNNNNNRRNRNNNNKKGNNKNNNQDTAVVKDEEMNDVTQEAPNNNHQAAETTTTDSDNDSHKKPHITDKKFADLKISAESRRALSQVFQYEFMTVVQAETLPVILQGSDCLAKAKTGTGKTLAFMIPAVEQLLTLRQQNVNNKSYNPMDICCLVISPTRELTYQIRTEAQNLLKFHKNMKVVACVGGTNINADRRALKESVQFVVATPGRLLDHLSNTDANGVRLADRMKNLKVLILDEADQLLDMGFRPDIQRILNILQPSRATRQTLLFSATVPDSVSEIANLALRSPHKYIDTVGDDPQEQTHLHVQQELYVTPSGAAQIQAIWQILVAETTKANASKTPYKMIVFFTTARLTGFMAELFNSMRSDQQRGFGKVLEIHSRKSQAVRQKASDKFRKGTNAVLFSSDVSARGMDYPDVTFVLQVGLTNRAQYIHRLGRTARAGKKGKGALLVATEEERFMVKTELSDMPLVKIPEIPNATNTGDKDCPIMLALANVRKDRELKESAEQAYRAWLGYYNGHLRKVSWNKKQLVVAANQWAKDIGIEQPKMQKKTIGKMGLKGVPGLLIE